MKSCGSLFELIIFCDDGINSTHHEWFISLQKQNSNEGFPSSFDWSDRNVFFSFSYLVYFVVFFINLNFTRQYINADEHYNHNQLYSQCLAVLFLFFTSTVNLYIIQSYCYVKQQLWLLSNYTRRLLQCFVTQHVIFDILRIVLSKDNNIITRWI